MKKKYQPLYFLYVFTLSSFDIESHLVSNLITYVFSIFCFDSLFLKKLKTYFFVILKNYFLKQKIKKYVYFRILRISKVNCKKLEFLSLPWEHVKLQKLLKSLVSSYNINTSNPTRPKEFTFSSWTYIYIKL